MYDFLRENGMRLLYDTSTISERRWIVPLDLITSFKNSSKYNFQNHPQTQLSPFKDKTLFDVSRTTRMSVQVFRIMQRINCSNTTFWPFELQCRVGSSPRGNGHCFFGFCPTNGQNRIEKFRPPKYMSTTSI